MDKVIFIPHSDTENEHKNKNVTLTRDYICPCGKSYLSYPALFTHIKQKHNGQAPGQIIKPKNASQNRRGRPRLIKNESNKPEENQQNTKQSNQVLIELERYVRKQNWARKIPDLRSHYEKSQFYRTYKSCKQNNFKQKTSQITCSVALYRLLNEIQSHQQFSFFFQEFLVIVMFLVRGISQDSEGVCCHPEKIINFANEFITKHVEMYIKEQGLQNEQFFKIQRILNVVEYIYKWLYQKQYTSRWIKINPQFLKYI